MEHAAFGGIGAIGLHALRLANIAIGERVGVLGLGVLGQVVSQLARAAGAWVLASDPLSSRAQLARSLGADAVTAPADWADAARDFTKGAGLDAVLVVAGTPDSAAPARQALEALRFRGRLIVVGNVKTDWDRETLFQKEATVQVSRAGGPGRYDPEYEREGRDFPPGLVPWTEGRNLRAFTDLLGAGRVRVDALISETLPADRAAQAYSRLMESPKDTMAIVLKFDQ
jgi:threonine dehydrogenase-like Zn-dependent dehydrogenase